MLDSFFRRKIWAESVTTAQAAAWRTHRVSKRWSDGLPPTQAQQAPVQAFSVDPAARQDSTGFVDEGCIRIADASDMSDA